MANDKYEQLLLLAKGAKGNSAVEIIKKATETPGVFVFGELLEIPGIKELEGNEHSAFHKLLLLFAYGNYSDYLKSSSDYPTLNDLQKRKLKQLTLLSLAARKKRIPCSELQTCLEMASLRDLEDLIIEMIYSDALRGKLDQSAATLEVEHALGRDIRPEEISELSKVLSDWCDKCESVILNLSTEMLKANERRAASERHKASVQNEIDNMKLSIKAQVNQNQRMEVDDAQHPDLIGADSLSMKSMGSGASGAGQEKDKTKKGMFKGLKSSRNIFSNK